MKYSIRTCQHGLLKSFWSSSAMWVTTSLMCGSTVSTWSFSEAVCCVPNMVTWAALDLLFMCSVFNVPYRRCVCGLLPLTRSWSYTFHTPFTSVQCQVLYIHAEIRWQSKIYSVLIAVGAYSLLSVSVQVRSSTKYKMVSASCQIILCIELHLLSLYSPGITSLWNSNTSVKVCQLTTSKT